METGLLSQASTKADRDPLAKDLGQTGGLWAPVEKFAIPVAMLVSLIAFVRYAAYASRRLWFDEVYTATVALQPEWIDVWNAFRTAVDFQPPLFSYTTRISWMLFATHTTLSVPALTGTILCIGIATANSILVISTARDKLAAGAQPLDAALEAGFSRFRPVLMTALAMLIGMLPMALGLADGGEQNAPLGRAVIGGLAAGTLSTLIFVPVVFGIVHSWLARRKAAREAAAASAAPATPAAHV